MRTTTTLLMLAAVLAVIPARAHHSFAAEYDANQPIAIKGKINKVDWVNPHSWVVVDVTGADGKVTTWRCETAPPNALFRLGWTRSSLPKGTEVTVDGFRAKDGTPTMNARSLTTPDGKRLFAGSANDGAPAREGDNQK